MLYEIKYPSTTVGQYPLYDKHVYHPAKIAIGENGMVKAGRVNRIFGRRWNRVFRKGWDGVIERR